MKTVPVSRDVLRHIICLTRITVRLWITRLRRIQSVSSVKTANVSPSLLFRYFVFHYFFVTLTYLLQKMAPVQYTACVDLRLWIIDFK